MIKARHVTQGPGVPVTCGRWAGTRPSTLTGPQRFPWLPAAGGGQGSHLFRSQHRRDGGSTSALTTLSTALSSL